MNAETQWRKVTGTPVLAANDVHLIRFRLDRATASMDDLCQTLNPDERRRAARFKRTVHQRRFAAGRQCLRAILGAYTGQSPEAVSFEYGPHGKPGLTPAAGRPLPYFNLSHSGDEAVCALRLAGPVGIDIERVQERRPTDSIARRFFSPDEAEHLSQCAAGQRVTAFYQYWTAKEALLKGNGGGLTLPLNRCRFELGRSPFGLHFDNLPEVEDAAWTVFPVDVAPGYAAAAAVSGPLGPVSFYQWVPDTP